MSWPNLPVFLGCVIGALLVHSERLDAQEALCPITQILTFEELHEHVDCLASALENRIWQENLVPAIQFTAGIQVPDRELSFRVSKGCAVVPNYDPRRRSINFQHFLIYYSLNYQQAVLAQLMGFQAASRNEDVAEYFEGRLLPSLQRERVRCPGSALQTSGRIPMQLPSILDGTMTPEEQENIRNVFENYPKLDALQAYIAFSPTFFVLLHEVGHSVLHPEGTDGSMAQETAADEYAAAVLSANELPVTIALGLHQIIQSAGRGGDDAKLACRIENLARNYPVPKSFAEQFGQHIANRLEGLRTFYIERYHKKCVQ
jgi:hypothetical protein